MITDINKGTALLKAHYLCNCDPPPTPSHLVPIWLSVLDKPVAFKMPHDTFAFAACAEMAGLGLKLTDKKTPLLYQVLLKKKPQTHHDLNFSVHARYVHVQSTVPGE